MRSFVVIANIRQYGNVEFDASIRIVVQARSINDAYKAVRNISAFKHAFLKRG